MRFCLVLLCLLAWSQAAPLRNSSASSLEEEETEDPLSQDSLTSAVLALMGEKKSLVGVDPTYAFLSKDKWGLPAASQTDDDELEAIFQGVIAELNGSVTPDFSQLGEAIHEAERMESPRPDRAQAQEALDLIGRGIAQQVAEEFLKYEQNLTAWTTPSTEEPSGLAANMSPQPWSGPRPNQMLPADAFTVPSITISEQPSTIPVNMPPVPWTGPSPTTYTPSSSPPSSSEATGPDNSLVPVKLRSQPLAGQRPRQPQPAEDLTAPSTTSTIQPDTSATTTVSEKSLSPIVLNAAAAKKLPSGQRSQEEPELGNVMLSLHQTATTATDDTTALKQDKSVVDYER